MPAEDGKMNTLLNGWQLFVVPPITLLSMDPPLTLKALEQSALSVVKGDTSTRSAKITLPSLHGKLIYSGIWSSYQSLKQILGSWKSTL
jgi:hypothetical protein